jgi:hypothetical protein
MSAPSESSDYINVVLHPGAGVSHGSKIVLVADDAQTGWKFVCTNSLDFCSIIAAYSARTRVIKVKGGVGLTDSSRVTVALKSHDLPALRSVVLKGARFPSPACRVNVLTGLTGCMPDGCRVVLAKKVALHASDLHDITVADERLTLAFAEDTVDLAADTPARGVKFKLRLGSPTPESVDSIAASVEPINARASARLEGDVSVEVAPVTSIKVRGLITAQLLSVTAALVLAVPTVTIIKFAKYRFGDDTSAEDAYAALHILEGAEPRRALTLVLGKKGGGGSIEYNHGSAAIDRETTINVLHSSQTLQ